MTTGPISVLFILPSFAGGGAERVSITLMEGLDRTRFQPDLMVLSSAGPLADRVSDRTTIVDLARPSLRHALPSLIAEIRRRKPDIVFSSFGYISLPLLALRMLLPAGMKIVAREANLPSLSLSGSAAPYLLRQAYPLFYRKAARIVATSHRMADEMTARYRVPPSKLDILYNPVDVAFLREKAAENASGPPVTGPSFVAVGRLVKQKGFDRLIDLWRRAPDDATLTVIGDGPDRSMLEDRVRSGDLTGRIRFPGFCKNPWAEIARADALLMPSRWEGMPNAALEALACGTPVIATLESGGIEEVATMAGSGNVTVVSFGDAFLSAVSAVQAGAKQAAGPSLLPSSFEMEKVAEQFQHILYTCLTKPVSA